MNTLFILWMVLVGPGGAEAWGTYTTLAACQAEVQKDTQAEQARSPDGKVPAHFVCLPPGTPPIVK